MYSKKIRAPYSFKRILSILKDLESKDMLNTIEIKKDKKLVRSILIYGNQKEELPKAVILRIAIEKMLSKKRIGWKPNFYNIKPKT